MRHYYLAALAWALGGSLAWAGMKVEQSDTTIKVDVGNGTQLTFAVQAGQVLGLSGASVQGQSLRSTATLVRPVIFQEWTDKPFTVTQYTLRNVETTDQQVTLVLDMQASRDPQALRNIMVMAPDFEAAKKNWPAAWAEILNQRNEAVRVLDDFIKAQPEYVELAQQRDKLEASTDKKERKNIPNVTKAMETLASKITAEKAPQQEALKPHLKAITIYDAKLAELADRYAQIHRDYYSFAMLQLPSAILTPAEVAKQGTFPSETVGTLKWVIKPATENVAGWTWRGWQHHYEYDLVSGQKINAIRELGTWELDGTAVGNTLVNMRYRGLGGIQAPLTALQEGKPESGVRNAFTTTEILPGAVGAAPVVSPAVPGDQKIASRAEAMKYRHGAWIAHLQRGSGTNWIEYMYRPQAALAMYYTRMEAIRGLEEVWPGDQQISHTDNLFFPRGTTGRSTPKRFMALTQPRAQANHEWETRWQEMHLQIRDQIAADLNLKLSPPLPSIGFNWDSGWEFRIGGALGQVENMQKLGIKRIYSHHPGWFNGRGLRQKETSYPIPEGINGHNPTGGDCAIHDYVPQSPAVATKWKELYTKLHASKIEYWGWITAMVYETGPVVKEFGNEAFCRNRPGAPFSDGYPPSLFNVPILHEGLKKWWCDRMDTAIKDPGLDGFWTDSWQNLYMSTMNFQRDDWAPHVRQWWLWVAEVSQRGVGFIAESQGFPALSCSVEVGDAPTDCENDWFAYINTNKWYRGTLVPGKGTAKADRIFFRTMANYGPITPGDGDATQVPSFASYSAQYIAALPLMRRPYQMPEHKGVLWLGTKDDEGVLFAFEDMPLPADTQAVHIVTGEKADSLKAHTTYRVTGKNLRAAVGVQTPPEKDGRNP